MIGSGPEWLHARINTPLRSRGETPGARCSAIKTRDVTQWMRDKTIGARMRALYLTGNTNRYNKQWPK